MAKRKSEDNPTTTANGELAASNKKRRLSDEETAAKRPKKEKREKKDRKDKKARKEVEPEEEVVDMAMTDLDNVKPEVVKQEAAADDEAKSAHTEGGAVEKTKKKRRKNKKAVKEEGEDKPTATATEGQAGQDGEAAADEEAVNSRPAKKSRFIVFVGNLPFSATVPDIEKHFSAVKPTSIRLLHEKTNPSKSRGIAFVEFAGFDHMKTCLKTLHHSTITCQGRDHRGRPKPEERQINVELTVGGGGNTEGRKEKLKVKNERLNEQRERRAVEEEKQRIKKEQERLTKEGDKKGGPDGIHPSRRARVPAGRR